MYQHVKVPAGGQKITVNADFSINVPDNPIIPYIEGDGTGFDITPVMSVVPPDIELNPNPTEVAQWFEAPLDFVLDPANHERHTGEFNGRTHTYWCIRWQEHEIWGATAGIIVNLSRRLRWHG